MSSEKATPNPPESSIVEKTLAMLLASIQEQNRDLATLNSQRDSDAPQPEIELLDLLLEDRRIAAESIQLAARQAVVPFLRRRNDLVPLHRLPSEVLTLILLKSLDFKHGFRHSALQSLAQVAHRWWEIIRSEPRFWTCVWLGFSGGNIALNIRKTGNLLLQLCWHNAYWFSEAQSILSLVRAHADRWFKICIATSTGGTPPLFKVAFEQHSFSNLEFLDMVGFNDVVHVELGSFKRLRHASLSFIPCLGHDDKRIEPTPLLTYLYLRLSPSKSYPTACLDSFLRHCPNLQELEIQNLSKDSDGGGNPNQSPSVISLPTLRSLSIRNLLNAYNSAEIPILGLIRCPNLATFDIGYSGLEEEGSIDAAAVFRALRASSQLEPDALPMSSVIRNIGDSIYLRVVLGADGVEIRAEDRRTPLESPSISHETSSLRCVLPAYRLDMEGFSRGILPHLTSLETPIEINIPGRLQRGGSRWSEILEGFRNVTMLEFRGSTKPIQNLVVALSGPSSLLPSASPRAPRLETLTLHDWDFNFSWTLHIHEMAPHVAAMLQKRRELFKSAGMVWPSNFQVKAASYIFNEEGGSWKKQN